MNAREVNVFLTRAALLDSRMKRVDPVEQADMAAAWADALPDVSLQDALRALNQHVRSSAESIRPAHITAIVGVVDEPGRAIPNLDLEIMREQLMPQLEAAGVSWQTFWERKHDRDWVLSTFPQHAAVEQAAASVERGAFAPYSEDGERE